MFGRILSKRSARDMRPLWRDPILKVWGGDPLLCPCCKGTMTVTGTMIRHGKIECKKSRSEMAAP